MPSCSRTAFLALLAATAPCAAQRQQWLVSSAGGAGVHFTDLPPAVAAAAPGDVIFLRSGDYTGFTTSKGVRILALPATSAPRFPTVRAAASPAPHTLGVVNLPRSETFAMVGVAVEAPAGSGVGVEVASCAGVVHLEYCSFTMGEPAVSSTPRPGLLVTQSPRVDIAYCEALGFPAALFASSNVRGTNSRFLGIDGGFFAGGVTHLPGHGVLASASTVDLSRCQLQGGSVLGLAVLADAGSGLASSMSDWTIRSDAAGSVVAGSLPGRPVVAARGTGNLRYDPPSTFVGTGGGAGTEPTLSATPDALPSLAHVYLPVSGTMRVDIHGPPGATFVFLFGLPDDPLIVPGVGELLLSVSAVFPVAAGIIGTGGYASLTIPIPVLPLHGEQFAWQALRSVPTGGLAFSNRTPFVYR
ncbi:MAG: hypothetical protein IPM29_30580 [Planctomycetes bacterium]|nr:hypothetical protein [Planctomycetota bacterium]